MVQPLKKMAPLPRSPEMTGSSQKWSFVLFTRGAAPLLQKPVPAKRSVPHSRGQIVQFFISV